MSFCNNCGRMCRTVRGDEGFICCTSCGRIIDSDMFANEITFIKGAGGQSQMSGRFVKSVESGGSESRERTLLKGRDEISYLVDKLYIAGGDNIIDQASKFYKIAVERNFTRGRRTSLVAAACLYIACRENKKAFLLIDFSEELRVNVYVLGAVFLQLCQLLRLEEHPIVQKLVDPSLFIHRFTERLLGGKNTEVSRTALRILASMKRDWMQTGRKPSGLCGAALYISAHAYGLKCLKSDIGNVVHICEATLTKRLIEFENTESGSLTIEEFNAKAEELAESGSRQVAVSSSGAMKLLCEHKDSDRPHFAHGLCKSCYDDFVELSGGLQGGSDPPAFQRSERERMTKPSAEKQANETDMCEKEVESFSECDHYANISKISDSQRSKGSVNESPAFEGSVCGKLNGNEDMDNVAGDESESLSDIDDLEVSGYIHNDVEKRMKKIIWESLNREYLEEEAAKEKAAKEAFEAQFENCPEEFLESRKLAALAKANVAKKNKEMRQKRALEAKNAAPAQTAAEATRQMLKKKKLSSKINYDVLDKLFDETAPEDRHTESDFDDDANGQKHVKEQNESELDLLDNSNNIGQEDEYGEENSGTGMYGHDLYLGNQEEEYEDYGYEF